MQFRAQIFQAEATFIKQLTVKFIRKRFLKVCSLVFFLNITNVANDFIKLKLNFISGLVKSKFILIFRTLNIRNTLEFPIIF